MRKSSMMGTLAALSIAAGAAYANEPQKGDKEKEASAAAPTGMPAPAKPAEETRALSALAVDGKLMGHVPANAFKEGSPAMTTSGTQDCKWSVDNLWLVCELKETIGEGKESLTWRGHATLGYDYLAKEYRGTIVDNMGVTNVTAGKIDGNTLIMTSVLETNFDGHKCKGRMTWDWSNPNLITIKTERSTDGGDFKLVEEATLRPTKKEKIPGNA